MTATPVSSTTTEGLALAPFDIEPFPGLERREIRYIWRLPAPSDLTNENILNYANQALRELGLNVAGFGWRFGTNTNKSSLGRCIYSKRTLELSRHFLGAVPVTDMWNTVLHEIAHAIAGPYAGHGHLWKRIHTALGGTAEATATLDAEAREKVQARSKWHGVCPADPSHTFARHRMTASVRTSACPHHGRDYNPDFRIKWTQQF